MKKILLAAVLIAAIPRLALAIDAGVANGLLTVGKTKIKLDHAYAHRFNDEEKLGEGPELRILLADRDLPEMVMAGFDGPMKLDRMAREGKVRGLLVRLDPRMPKDHIQGTVLMAPRDPQASLIFFTSKGQDELKDLKVDNLRVSGRLDYQSDTEKFFADLPPIVCSAAFSAPLFHDEPFTAKLSGRAAVQSPQAEALRSYMAALASGDLDGAQKFATEARWAELKAQEKRMGKEKFRSLLKEEAPSSAELDRQISRVLVRGSHAFIVIKEQGGTATESLVKENGSWKVD